MIIWMLGGMACVFVFVTSVILPWINHNAIGDLRLTIARLQADISRLKHGDIKSVAQDVAPVADDWAQTPAPAPIMRETSSTILADDFAAEHAVPGLHAAPASVPNESFEQQFGGRAFVWLGGVALALAGFFLVKYSIEAGFLNEQVRVILGIVFGFALLGSGYIVRTSPRVADGTRISQALAGAGIADLYGCLFAATTLYHLIPSWFGFTCMAGVTGMTLLMSLRYGAPIAALGLIGGFATPLLIHGDPNAPLLFGYLFLVFGGLLAVARRQEWWWLTIPATLTAFAWVGVWLLGSEAAADSVWLALFLLGVGAAAVLASHDYEDEDPFGPLPIMQHIAIGGALLLMGAVAYTAHFGAFEWDMYGLLSIGVIVLAWFDNRTYGFAPWIAMATNAGMLLAWDYVDPDSLAIAIAFFGIIFAGSGHALATRAKNPVPWTMLGAASTLVYYLLAYHRLENLPPSIETATYWLSADQLWAGLAFLLAAFHGWATTQSFVVESDEKQRHILQATYTVVTSSFCSLGFAIILHQNYFAFAIAAQVLTLSWIDTRTDIPALRDIAKVLTALFGLMLLPDLLALCISPFDVSSGFAGTNLDKLQTTSSLLFRFGLPSAMFIGAGRLLRDKNDDEFVAVLELMAIALFGVLSYNLIGAYFSDHGMRSPFIARGVFTDVLLVLGFVALRSSREFNRPALEWGGIGLAGLATARIIGFDLLFHNPLWTREMVGSTPLFNGLTLAYGLPTLAAAFIGNELALKNRVEATTFAKIAGFVLAFIFVSFSVRQFYHGTYLDVGVMGNAEVYTYSVAWLALGIAFLLAGTMRQDGMMRVASLIIMLLTVGKAFLYDASELTGLLRVLSFFGLGLSLLGLSWFYSRFVFGTKTSKE